MVIIGPFVAFAAAHLVVEMKSGARLVPGARREFSGPLVCPYQITPLNISLPICCLAGVLLLLGFGVIMMVYSIIYSIMGPPRYGPLDAPPIRAEEILRR